MAVSDAVGSYTLSEPSVPKVFDPIEELSTQVCVWAFAWLALLSVYLREIVFPPWSMDAPVLVA